MAPNPLLIAHRIGKRDDRWLRRIFARYLGSAKHPRGQTLTAYRKARKAMAGAFDPGSKVTPGEVLAGLRSELTGIAFTALTQARDRGLTSGTAQVDAYRDDGARIVRGGPTLDIAPFLDAWLAAFEQQERAVRGLIAAGDADAITGDGGRMGVLAPGVVLREGARWIATTLHTTVQTELGEPLGDRWGKQALPNIDGVTTDCCLTVAGQIQPIDAKFHLTGEPRFSDYQDWSPFHWNCRTSCVLYRSDYDDGITRGIREQVRAERAAREG